MRWIQTVTALAVASLVTGCVRGDARYAAYAGEALVAGAGLSLVMMADPDQHEGWDALAVKGVETTGLVLAGLGLVGFGATYLTNAGDETPAAPPPPPAPDPASLAPVPTFAWANPDAVRMTRQARNAAVARRCDAVRQLSPLVLRADPAYHQGVFAVDPAIASCR